MADDIKYIGVEPEYNESPKKEKLSSNYKKDKEPKKETFRTNKYNSKVDDFIKSTKPKYKHTNKVVVVLIIALLVWVFKPIGFLRAKLDEKRSFYANQSNNVSIDLNYNLFDNLVYASSYNYYKDLRGTISNPLPNSSINATFDLFHKGVDLNGYNGQQVLSAQEGTVIDTGFDEKHGNYIMIEHYINGYTVYTYYSNLTTSNVYTGQYVSQGQQIGTITGSESGSSIINKDHCHLHFALRKTIEESSGIDPMLVIAK